MKDKFMYRAIELAMKGSGFVNPHPLSGAVIVKEDRIIGEGYYKAYNEDSAELEAVKNSSESLEGAEIYLNIEPFKNDADINKSIEAIVSSGIKKIYLGMMNPNPEKALNFSEIVKAKGIKIVNGVLQEQCEEINEIYNHYITKKLPFVFTKWAMTLDGKLASRTGDSKWISSEESLEFVHHLRQRVAAIMVGENTVRMDDPLLTTRLEGIEISNPLRVILSKYGNLPEEAKVLKVDDRTKTLIIASAKIPKEKEEFFIKKGIDIIKLEEKSGRLDFKDIVKVLGEKGIDSLYIEGGSEVLASAFEGKVVSKVYAAVAPKIIGGKDAVTPVGGAGIERMRDAIVLKKVKHEIIGADVIFKGYIE
ncbi:bifunctional diaminohydroxyphosphoribosylaminopyrimidine deaminase/5-amino-6-(5-phosphoribosylamino)uracil reductase RibD [Clostridium sp. YIM B02515]|uniref:Riboflavin biosynthesis protein RibD n=1 Tax=Clostridium rhizosphaerae TaxID=2803861 RepID=A0ABS1T8N3_9CLOT|nr:bifunctional diaminohydroxyphosphoribosylaminopyrimidine deaminase/5-amino-6-(5-phosphoribosylamino)uracil reductase RibD [Clostridium rhizosphaerae]MBL4935472.1 bifunctional diaminohydroxyphosphoribosylaminopyrimidine deaminase/5-amino-6-(5-phosphoribosylamino)uracil reductase RibD [Clostridium rhizosphaerae]